MNVCIITSMLSFPDKPLSYSKVRSVFTPVQRFQQTLRSIASVRRSIPRVKVVLIEMGAHVNTIREVADWTIHVGKHSLVRLACDSSHKGLGEAVGLLAAADQLDNAGDYYFKLSGRYCLNDKFQIEQWNHAGFAVRLYGQNRRSMSTRLYGFPADMFKRWRSALRWSLPCLALGRGLEYELWPHLQWLNALPVLGISGQVATDGTLINE